MRIVAGLRAVDVSSSHQFEEEIGAASSKNGLFIAKMEFSVRTGGMCDSGASLEERLRATVRIDRVTLFLWNQELSGRWTHGAHFA